MLSLPAAVALGTFFMAMVLSIAEALVGGSHSCLNMLIGRGGGEKSVWRVRRHSCNVIVLATSGSEAPG